MSASKTTTNHDTIRKWAEAREGKPASVAGTEEDGESAGLLRIDFPGGAGAAELQEISWEDFFRKFDEENLEFLYQDKVEDGGTSRFCKFVRKAK
jgi:hypothetical protein